MSNDKVIVTPMKDMRFDGYVNMLNKAGTKQDNSIAYHYYPEYVVDDVTLSNIYVDNGLFAKIINRPSRDAVSKGLDLTDFGDDLSKKIQRKLNQLKWKQALTTAEEWSRLYGGSIIVMITDDGRGLDEPLDINHVTAIKELHVFERAIISPDYSHFGYSMYDFDDNEGRPFDQPLFYDVYSMYGNFRVHYTRCLVFKNGKFPEFASLAYYRGWGVPTYYQVAKAVRMTITGHQDAEKLLERSTIGVFSMKGLSQMLATEAGEDKALTRIQAIDMARNILNSMVIDADGESYQYLTTPMSGVSDILEKLENYLSAVTDIPQTILFGGSPKGMDATGDNDMQNYYQLLQSIQEDNLSPASQTLIQCVLQEFKAEDKSLKIPDYEIKFNPFHQETEMDKANIENTKADTDASNANTLSTYIGLGLISKEEGREALSKPEGFDFKGFVDPKKAAEMPPNPNAQGEDNDNPTDPDGGPGGGQPAPDAQSGGENVASEATNAQPQQQETAQEAPQISSITYKFKQGKGGQPTGEMTTEGTTAAGMPVTNTKPLDANNLSNVVEETKKVTDPAGESVQETTPRATGDVNGVANGVAKNVAQEATKPDDEKSEGKVTPEVTNAKGKVTSQVTKSSEKGVSGEPEPSNKVTSQVTTSEKPLDMGDLSNVVEEPEKDTDKVQENHHILTEQDLRDAARRSVPEAKAGSNDEKTEEQHDAEPETTNEETAESDSIVMPKGETFVPVDKLQKTSNVASKATTAPENGGKEIKDERSKSN